jgi:hypothetical protein
MEPAEGKKQIAQIIAIIVTAGIAIKFIISLLGSIATKEELIRVYKNLPQDKVVKVIGLRDHIKSDKEIKKAAEGLLTLQFSIESINSAMEKGQLSKALDLVINANGLIADLEKKYGFSLKEEKDKLLQARFELAEMIKNSQNSL